MVFAARGCNDDHGPLVEAFHLSPEGGLSHGLLGHAARAALVDAIETKCYWISAVLIIYTVNMIES